MWGGIYLWNQSGGKVAGTKGSSGVPFATQPVNGLTVDLLTPKGEIHEGDNQITIEFRNAAGELVDAGEVKFDVDMIMPGMNMHAGGAAERTGTPGRYRTNIKCWDGRRLERKAFL